MRKIIGYRPDMKILNVEQLPKGLNLPYLECITSPYGELIAKQWRKSIPMQQYEVLVAF